MTNHWLPAVRAGRGVCLSLALVALATSPGSAGSTKSNLPALREATSKAQKEMQPAISLVRSIMEKLASDKAFGVKYSADVRKGDTEALKADLKTVGISVDVPTFTTQHACSGGVCVRLAETPMESHEHQAELATGEKEISTFFSKFSDETFARKFENAVMKGDKAEIAGLAKANGLSSYPVSDVTTDSDFHCHIKFDWLWEISFGW